MFFEPLLLLIVCYKETKCETANTGECWKLSLIKCELGETSVTLHLTPDIFTLVNSAMLTCVCSVYAPLKIVHFDFGFCRTSKQSRVNRYLQTWCEGQRVLVHTHKHWRRMQMAKWWLVLFKFECIPLIDWHDAQFVVCSVGLDLILWVWVRGMLTLYHKLHTASCCHQQRSCDEQKRVITVASPNSSKCVSQLNE